MIVIEGVDGCGKTTVISALAAKLRDEGYSVAEVSNIDDGGSVGECIRQMLLDHSFVSYRQIVMLYLSAMMATSKHIEDNLSEYDYVICSRWVLSTYAYGTNPKQEIYEGENVDIIRLINTVSKTSLLSAALTVILDVNPTVASVRLSARDDIKDYYSSIEKQEIVYDRLFLRVLEGVVHPCAIVSNKDNLLNETVDTIYHEILARIV